MKILLDLDGTVIIDHSLHPSFHEFKQFIESDNHQVLIWSSNDDGQVIAQLLGYPFLSKNSDIHPSGDILIDDFCDSFTSMCKVKQVFRSIDDFLEKYNENKDQAVGQGD